MRLDARAEAAAPLAFVMARVADAEAHEALARRRGIEVERLGPAGPVREGSAWRAGFEMLGARREARLRLARLEPAGLRLAVEVAGVEGELLASLAPLGPARTGLDVALTLGARTLGARLALGSARPARSGLERGLAGGVEAFARDAGAAWSRERPPS